MEKGEPVVLFLSFCHLNHSMGRYKNMDNEAQKMFQRLFEKPDNIEGRLDKLKTAHYYSDVLNRV